jgi:hypothetical protein
MGLSCSPRRSSNHVSSTRGADLCAIDRRKSRYYAPVFGSSFWAQVRLQRSQPAVARTVGMVPERHQGARLPSRVRGRSGLEKSSAVPGLRQIATLTLSAFSTLDWPMRGMVGVADRRAGARPKPLPGALAKANSRANVSGWRIRAGFAAGLAGLLMAVTSATVSGTAGTASADVADAVPPGLSTAVQQRLSLLRYGSAARPAGVRGTRRRPP